MIVNNIRALCEQRNMTIAALEREVGIGNGVIARWNDKNPRLDKAKAVADYFGVTVDDLLRAEPKPTT